MSHTPLLQCQAVCVGYTQPVAGPVSFAIHANENVGLLGHNGAGKSTLLKAITGEAHIFSGAIKKLRTLRIMHHRQQLVRSAQCPVTGHDLTKLTGANRQPPPPEIHHLLGQRLDTLSGGQFQIVHIWACIGSRADLILLDEPTNNLDTLSIHILGNMLLAKPHGRSLLIVSHDAQFMRKVCSRIIALT